MGQTTPFTRVNYTLRPNTPAVQVYNKGKDKKIENDETMESLVLYINEASLAKCPDRKSVV